MTWQRTTIQIPKDLKPKQRQAIALEVIDFIVERSKSGKDKNGKAFPKYSAGYANSQDFKNAGKSKGKVNLTLSSEMLNSIELLKDKAGELVIGFDKSDDELNGKAEGNILGTYGKDTPNPSKARDFLGIQEKDLNKILKNYVSDDEGRTEKLLRTK